LILLDLFHHFRVNQFVPGFPQFFFNDIFGILGILIRSLMMTIKPDIPNLPAGSRYRRAPGQAV
jgi:hypothetical protein